MAFRSNFFGAITHRGGRDARVPVRRRFAAIVGCADGNGLEYQCVSRPQLSAGTPTQPPGDQLPTLVVSAFHASTNYLLTLLQCLDTIKIVRQNI
ncbi:MAG: hypothetical protein LBQ66_09250 [Planctomycetaceae bacterium]|nr:hypothetical protein [Planctomycetaceae bacterium]